MPAAQPSTNVPVRQASFAGGEIAPTMYGRTDIQKWHSSVKTLKNFIPNAHGALLSRPGTKFIAETKFSGNNLTRLVPFYLSEGVTYVLEFGNLYIRFYNLGSQVLSAGVPYEVVTPYKDTDLARLKWAQIGNNVIICHPSYQPQKLTFISSTNWTIAPITFAVPNNFIGALTYAQGAYPTWSGVTTYNIGDRVLGSDGAPYVSFWQPNLNHDPTAAGNLKWWQPENDTARPPKQWSWVVTQDLIDQNGNITESLPTPAVTSPSGLVILYTDRPNIITWAINLVPMHTAGFESMGFNIYRGRSNVFGLVGNVDITGAFAFRDDGQTPDYTRIPPKGSNPFLVMPLGTPTVWSSVTTYNLYDQVTFGGQTWFSLQGGNLNNQPDISPLFWANLYQWPSVVTFFDQRLYFARTNLNPQTFWGSAVGNFFDFDRPLVLIDSDSVQFTLASLKREEIRSMVPMRSMLIFTASQTWPTRGVNGTPLTPSSIDSKPHEKYGANWMNPIVIGNEVLYVQEKGNRIRTVTYDFFRDMFNSQETSIWARHLFDTFTLVDWDYGAVPFNTIWMARNDGLLIGLTYILAQEIISIHQHPMTNGFVENVCSVSENTEDGIYFIIRRVINGVNRRFVERMSTRFFTDLRQSVCVDCALSFDGRNTSVTTMQVSGASYVGGGDVTITASANSFVVTDPGSVIVIDPDGLNGGPIRITVLAYTSATIVQGILDNPLPAQFQNIATSSWGWARANFSGMSQLAGQTITVLGDGNDLGTVVVSGTGTFVIPTPSVIVQAGLPFNYDLEPLNAFVPGEETRYLLKTVNRLFLEIDSGRKLFVGKDFNSLKEWPQRQVSDSFGSIQLQTLELDMFSAGGYDRDGRVAIRGQSPLPITIVGLTREVAFGGT